MSPTQGGTEDGMPRADAARRATAARRLSPATRDQLTVVTPLILGIVAVGLYATLASPHFLSLANAGNIVRQFAVLALVAIAQTPLMIAGQLDLSVASATSLATVIGAMLLVGAVPEGVVIVIVIGTGVLIGLGTGVVVAYTRVQPFILTLGLLSVLVAIANVLSNNRQISAPPPAFNYLSVGLVGPIPVPLVIVILAATAVAGLLRFTRLGRYAYATGSNEQAAYLAGVPTIRVKIVLYALNQGLVAVAGLILIGRLGGGDPSAGAGLELQAITAVVLGGAALSGGRGSVIGSLLGVLLIGLISNALNVAGVKQAYLQLIYGAVLMLSVVYSALVVRWRGRRGRRAPTATDHPAGAAGHG